MPGPVNQTTAFQHGQILECKIENGSSVSVIFDSIAWKGWALVSPLNDPTDGWYAKLSDLRECING